ncbi:ParB/RepB/Spo0J family partition protein [Streptomyces boninensis]|uniref:ParB/RepB/Spo0J family partition protein n=1 Tax=Streptomyces boninensis TaxID=2039455 RepID=UPI003B227E57
MESSEARADKPAVQYETGVRVTRTTLVRTPAAGAAALTPVQPPHSARLHGLERVPLSALLPADSPRMGGEEPEHVRALAAAGDGLPPIVVHRQTMRVIDGMHRLRAAELRGDQDIAARFFDGAQRDAFVLAVEANLGHGLPLTPAERSAAAIRIIASHPDWSDGRIANRTGISARTVSALRRRSTDTVQPVARIGRDGKVRPVDSSDGRRTAGRILARQPDASLREVATQAGISPGTVRDVRDRLRRGEDPVPDAAPRRRPAPPSSPAAGGRSADDRQPAAALEGIFQHLRQDPALRGTDNGRLLLRLLAMHLPATGVWDLALSSVPVHQRATTAAAARACACAWEELAVALTGTAGGEPGPGDGSAPRS